MPRCTRIALACVCLSIPLFTIGCGGSGSTAASLERPWEALPEDVVGVVHFDVASLLDSELFQAMDLPQRLPADAGSKLEELRQATGFDFTTDLESITIGAGYAGGESDQPYYMIVEGRFDLDRIEQYARESGEVEVETREGLTAYVSRPKQATATQPPVAAFLSTTTLIAASPRDFSKLVQSVNGLAPTAAASSLSRLMSASGGQLFFALHVPEEARQAAASVGADGANMLASLQEPLRHMETVLLTLNVAQGLELAVTAEVDSQESGKLVHDTAQGFLALGRMMASEKPETMELFDQMTLQQDGKTVKLSVVLTRQQIETAMSQAEAARIGTDLGG